MPIYRGYHINRTGQDWMVFDRDGEVVALMATEPEALAWVDKQLKQKHEREREQKRA
jgi:hypothetical protein